MGDIKTSIVDVWHGYGGFSAHVWHDGEKGNAASTELAFHFGEGDKPRITMDREPLSGCTENLSLQIYGHCERLGLAELLRATADELEKPAKELGDLIRIGPGPDDEPLGTIEEKGVIGEAALNDWFQSIGISYLYINQEPQTFANLFKGNLKRPDFLVLMESIGMIAVDAKNYRLHNGTEYSLPYEKELRRVLVFERLFRIPVWYAYMGEPENGETPWYWISALKALEVGLFKKNGEGVEFLSLNLRHFEKVVHAQDLGKLYTHRMPSIRTISAAR